LRNAAFLSLLAATLFLGVTVGSAQAETLRDALSVAFQTNPTIRAERARLRATRETRAQAISAALPQISANGSYSRVDSSQVSNFSGQPVQRDTQFNPLTANLEAEQRIFTGLRDLNAIKQAGARIRAGGAQLASVEQQVLRDVAGVYFDVQLNIAIYELNNANVTVLLRQQEMAKARFDVGEITLTDVAQADARLAAARADMSNAQGTLAISRAAYARLVGQLPGDLEPVEGLPELPETIDDAQAIAAEFAPPLIMAREQSEISRRQVKIAKGALLPTVSLTASYQYADQPSSFISRDEQFAYGARASIPLFLGGDNYSRIREAKALHASDRSRVDEAERQVTESVTAAWQQLIVARAVIKSAEAASRANKLALRGVRQEALLGTRTTLDTLNAEQELLNSEVTLARAQRDAQTAAYAVLAAIGLLTPEAVGITELNVDLETGDALLESLRR
jgi:outer membrane protein